MPNSKFHSLLLWTMLTGVVLCCYSASFSLAADQSEPGKITPVADMETRGLENKKEIVWYPYEEGLALAKAENKKTILFFYTDNCHYCKVMQTKTFAHDQVIDLLNSKFISVKVDADKKADVNSQYHIIGVPTSWFLESTGEQIGSQPGYIPPEEFTKMLEFILSERYK